MQYKSTCNMFGREDIKIFSRHPPHHNTKMSRRRPTPSGFALLALHGNICHGPESRRRSSP